MDRVEKRSWFQSEGPIIAKARRSPRSRDKEIMTVKWTKRGGRGRDHPFMTSTRSGEGVRLRWTHVDGGVQPHVDVHTEN